MIKLKCMGKWTEYKLKDVTTKIGSGATPIGGSNAYKREGISLIRSQNVLDFVFSYDGLAFIDETQAENLNNVTVEENDVLINITGDSVARVCMVPKSILPARVNQHVSIVRSKGDKAISNYLLYYLQSIKEQLLIMAEIGGTRNALTKAMLEDLRVYLPSLPEQKVIATILSSLDDKIDLLHRQNATFEKMAETLFKQKFIVEWRENWKEVTIEELATHLKVPIYPQRNGDTNYTHYSIPSFDNGKTPILESGREIQSNKYEVPPNCILFSKLNPHKDKRVWLLQNEVQANSICSTEFQVIYPKEVKYLFFLYGWVSLNENYREIASGVGGTSGSHQRIDPSSIFSFSCPIVNDDYLEEYNSLVKPIFNKQVMNQIQIKTLTDLRDSLLPKLMSGEVRVKS